MSLNNKLKKIILDLEDLKEESRWVDEQEKLDRVIEQLREIQLRN